MHPPEVSNRADTKLTGRALAQSGEEDPGAIFLLFPFLFPPSTVHVNIFKTVGVDRLQSTVYIASYADTFLGLSRMGGTRDKLKNVCVGDYS